MYALKLYKLSLLVTSPVECGNQNDRGLSTLVDLLLLASSTSKSVPHNCKGSVEDKGAKGVDSLAALAAASAC